MTMLAISSCAKGKDFTTSAGDYSDGATCQTVSARRRLLSTTTNDWSCTFLPKTSTTSTNG